MHAMREVKRGKNIFTAAAKAGRKNLPSSHRLPTTYAAFLATGSDGGPCCWP